MGAQANSIPAPQASPQAMGMALQAMKPQLAPPTGAASASGGLTLPNPAQQPHMPNMGIGMGMLPQMPASGVAGYGSNPMLARYPQTMAPAPVGRPLGSPLPNNGKPQNIQDFMARIQQQNQGY
jgi:hypothetical protein